METPKEEEEQLDDFELQLRQEEQERIAKASGESLPKGLTYTDEDGTVMEWDHERKAYFPKIDADFIAQYQINYGSSFNQWDGQGQELSEEEKKAMYSEYWRNYYDVYTQEQPAMPTLDVEGNPVDEDEDGGGKKETVEKKDSKTKSEGGNNAKAEESQQLTGDPTSEEHYQYNLYYYGKEYADAYREYYIDHPDDEAMPDWIREKGDQATEAGDAATDQSGQKGKKKGEKAGKQMKRKEPPREEGWFDVDSETSTQVYISGLPMEFTEEEFNELMAKCGLIMFDPHTHKPKLKLYRDAEGNVKGDGLCTYIKAESVALALEILDGFDVKGHKISVEKARFEMKGNFDPKKKKKKLSNKAKQKLREKQEKLFDWRPDKNPFQRAKCERTVILKNMFDVSEFDTNPLLINEVRDDVREECLTFGNVKKVVLYDRNPAGVVSVTFKEPEEADACIAALNGRWFAKKQIQAAAHDGKTRYDVIESEAEREKRLKGWEMFLQGEEHKEEGKQEEGGQGRGGDVNHASASAAAAAAAAGAAAGDGDADVGNGDEVSLAGRDGSGRAEDSQVATGPS